MRGRPRRFPAGLVATLFAAYLLALPPHLVHHLFDEDQGRPACPILAQSQHTPELQPDAPSLLPPLPSGTLEAPRPAASRPTLPVPASQPRAPPLPAPSV